MSTFEIVRDLFFVDHYGQRISVTNLLDIEDDDRIIAISSDDRLVELVDGCRLRVGSGHGCGSTTVSAQFLLRTIRRLPTGTFNFISALPNTITVELDRRKKTGKPHKKWLNSVRGIGFWLVDEDFDSNSYMEEALRSRVEMYVRQYA